MTNRGYFLSHITYFRLIIYMIDIEYDTREYMNNHKILQLQHEIQFYFFSKHPQTN